MDSTSTQQPANPITGPYALHITSGPGAKNSERVSLPAETTEAAAREAFVAKCAEMMERYPRRTKMAVNLMGVGHNVSVMGRIRETAASPVCQWTQRTNTNFSYPTGPTHYLDCANADIRRAAGGPMFDASDYQPLSA